MIAPEDELVEERASWQVRCLKFGKAISLIAWIAAGTGYWFSHSQTIPALFTPPGWLPDALVPLAKLATLLAAVLFATRCTNALIHFLWTRWRRHEVNANLSNSSERVPTEIWLMMLALPYSTVLWLAFHAATDRLGTIFDSSKWKDFILAVLILVVFFCYAQNGFRSRALKQAKIS